MALLGLLRNKRHERAGFELYASSVAAARDPYFFTVLAVPDTLDGRFDLVGLFAALLIHRLRALPAPGAALAQAVFDAMFADMDQNLREIGVGDMVIAKRVKAMWEAFHGRALAYETALAVGDQAALAESLTRNVWRGAAPPCAADRLAGIALAQAVSLARQDPARLAAGKVDFLAPSAVPA